MVRQNVLCPHRSRGGTLILDSTAHTGHNHRPSTPQRDTDTDMRRRRTKRRPKCCMCLRIAAAGRQPSSQAHRRMPSRSIICSFMFLRPTRWCSHMDFVVCCYPAQPTTPSAGHRAGQPWQLDPPSSNHCSWHPQAQPNATKCHAAAAGEAGRGSQCPQALPCSQLRVHAIPPTPFCAASHSEKPS